MAKTAAKKAVKKTAKKKATKKVAKKTTVKKAKKMTNKVVEKLNEAVEAIAMKVLQAKPEPKEPVVALATDKRYKTLYFNPNNKREIRIYPPCKRSIINLGEFHFMQFPYLVFGYMPDQAYGNLLFGCFSLQDLGALSEEELQNAEIFLMPFPAQFDRGRFGPCCLLSGNPWYYVKGDFDTLISRFWQTSFRGTGDYGQKNIVNCWNNMSFAEVAEMMQKAPKFYRATFGQFVKAIEAGDGDSRYL